MTLSSAYRRKIWRTFTDEDVIPLITITHPSLSAPIRLASIPAILSTGATTFAALGETWTRCPLGIAWPAHDGGPPRCEIRLPAYDPALAQQIRGLSARRAKFVVTAVAMSEPLVEQIDPVTLEMIDVQMDAISVTVSLSGIDYSGEPWPIDRGTPDVAPGVWRSARGL